MRPDQACFAEPADLVARRHALQLVQRVQQACARLGDNDDPGALHDLRVALRHLRGWLRSMREVLPVSRATRRRLGRLARRTNPARDAEVALELAHAHTARSSAFARAWLQARLGHCAQRARKRSCRRARRDWAHLSARLHREADARPRRHEDTAPFGSVFVVRLERLLDDLVNAACAPLSPGVQHRVRIRGKRLRYLVESVEETCPQAGALVALLRDMQDRLGEVNDLWHLGQRVTRLVGRAAREHGHRLCALAAQPIGNEHAVRSAHRRDPAPDLALVLRSILAERDTALAYNTRDLPAMLAAIETATRELIAGVTAATPASGRVSRP